MLRMFKPRFMIPNSHVGGSPGFKVDLESLHTRQFADRAETASAFIPVRTKPAKIRRSVRFILHATAAPALL